MGTQTVSSCDRKSCGHTDTFNEFPGYSKDTGYKFDHLSQLLFCSECFQKLETLREKHEEDFKILFEEFME